MSGDDVNIRLPVFKPGQTVQYQGRHMTVSYVLLRRGELRVFLEGLENSVSSEEVSVEPTDLVYKRKP